MTHCIYFMLENIRKILDIKEALEKAIFVIGLYIIIPGL